MKFSVKESLQFGWEEFKTHWKLLLSTWVVILAVNVFLRWWQDNINQDLWPVLLLVGIVSGVFSLLTTLGVNRMALKITDGETTGLGELVSQWKMIPGYFLAQVLVGLATVVGFILLIVPGLIVGTRLQFVGFAMVDKGLGPIAAIKHSWEVTKGSVLRLWLFNFVIGLVTILGVLALGVGVLVAVPVTMISTAWVYRKLG